MKRVELRPDYENAPDGWGVFYIRPHHQYAVNIVLQRLSMWADASKTRKIVVQPVAIEVDVSYSDSRMMAFAGRSTEVINFLKIYLERDSDAVMFKLTFAEDEDFRFVDKLPQATRRYENIERDGWF